VKNDLDRSGEVPWIPPALADDDTGLVGVGGSLDPTCLLRAYSEGVFPWFSDGDPVLWWSPDPRAIFDVHAGLHISRRLARTLRSGKFQVTVNRAFGHVIRACGDRREGTWITREMVSAYEELHRLRFAHSVEAWQDGELAGGVYGVSLNGFFAAESMFFRRTDASKVALVALFERLQTRGFELVDTQMLTEHTERLGAFEVSRDRYLDKLRRAIAKRGVRFD
jgi:leucyl/phenylalanyl-tRNA---protein transferase